MLPLLAFVATAYTTWELNKNKPPDNLKPHIDNGYQFRDITFDTMSDYIKHPDVVNNNFASSKFICKDKGVFGIDREYSRLYSGLSQITVLHRTDSLYL